MAACDRDCRDIAEFLDSMWQCFDNVDKALTDERSSIPLDYLESRLEDHFQVVNAIAIAIQDNSRVVTRYIFSSLIPNFSSKFGSLIPKMWQRLIPDPT